MEIGGFEIGFIVTGMVETAKKFGINDNGSFALALGLGVLLFGYGSAVEAGLISEAITVWATVGIRAIGYTFSLPGWYDIVVKRIAKV